ncbi:hypothetical protein VNO78_05936 [Psophocarpus tetragonolobus]|uniref:mitogen-activated protein kinase kinase kinase n=1 Tax=Psophocarpus tetragonolobus TaxID=3891 RepID=A0AAN9SRI9_PSOTE
MEWHRGHTIGHGASATVSTATCRGGVFAVKSSELPRSKPLKKEQNILSSLSSPYVVAYKGCDITMENNKLLFNLFMEYMPFGTLAQATRRCDGGRLNELTIACYTRQIVEGLEYLHSKGLVHCDIKGANILIGEYGAKIGDFGCAKSVEDSTAAIGGTPMFMAPEVARREEQGCASDIWSLGCTMVEMATGGTPWPIVADPFSMLYHIAYSNEVPQIPSFLSKEAKDFLGKCLNRNPKERWRASELLKHPFIGKLCLNKEGLESNSSSPTSVLEQGFWSCVEESESFGNLVHTTFEISAAWRIRMLAVSSRVPCWGRHHDENWITARSIRVEGFGNCGTGTTSTSRELSH